MAKAELKILNRLYFVSGIMFVFAIAVAFKLCSIQFLEGDKYRSIAQKRTIKNVEIPANRGNVYSADGSLLATSIPKYDVRIDAVQPKQSTFEKYIKPLADSLSKFSGKSSREYQTNIRKARKNKNQYYLRLGNLIYPDTIHFLTFPLLK